MLLLLSILFLFFIIQPTVLYFVYRKYSNKDNLFKLSSGVLILLNLFCLIFDIICYFNCNSECKEVYQINSECSCNMFIILGIVLLVEIIIISIEYMILNKKK